ncbi:regulator of chromosome condensation 1/beta-lactamase-inhibitor protein II, partial [Baffinella frigidus]
EDGSVKCWGYNDSARLGDGTGTDRRDGTPVDVVGLVGKAVAVAGGKGAHTCVLMEDGSIKCWGYNINGQLGDDTKSVRATPVDVVGLGGKAVAVAVGGDSTCALMVKGVRTEDGSLKCWGGNDAGQLGDGTNDNSNTPVLVLDW